jgi:hypothetical protein
VIQPSLKVIWRGLNDHSWLESFRLHPLNAFDGKIVEEAQTVRAGWADVDVRTFSVLVAQPFDRLLDLDRALPLSENHLAGVAPDANIEDLAAHRAQLDSHQPLHDNG